MKEIVLRGKISLSLFWFGSVIAKTIFDLTQISNLNLSSLFTTYGKEQIKFCKTIDCLE